MSDARTDAMTQPEVDRAMDSLPGARHGPLYALSFRNFRLFFVGQLISVAGTWMQAVAQGWVVWDITHQARWLGIVSGAGAIPYVLFAIPGGNAADRRPRRDILVWTQAVAMLLAFVLAILAAGLFHTRLQGWHIALLAAIGGVVNAYNMPAQQAFVTDMVDEREALANAIALNSLRFNLARFIGPIMAGVVLVKLGAAWCFGLNGLSFIAVIISLMMMRLPEFRPHPAHGSVWDGFAYIARTSTVFRATFLIGIGSLFTWSASTLFPMLATHFHQGAAGFSRMTAINGVGAATGGVFLTVWGDRFERRSLVYAGAILFATALIFLARMHSFTATLVCLVIAGFAMILFAISCNTKVQTEAPDKLRGRVMAVYSLVFQGFMPLGSLEIGILAERVGAQAAIYWNAMVALCVTLCVFLWALVSERRQAAV